MNYFVRHIFNLSSPHFLYCWFVTKGKVIYPFRKVHLTLRSSANVKGQGRLAVGKCWSREGPVASQFILSRRSQLVVNGNFDIYTGCDVHVRRDAQLTLGSGYLNKRGRIACYNSITIGENVIISENVTIRDSDNHSINGKLNQAPIVIEDDVWVGLNATILNGVTIGKGSVVAAGAVVVNDVPPHSLVAGCPAKIKKTHVSWTP